MTVFRWSQTANSNDTIDSTINFKEQQSPGSLNNSSRAVMAAIAKWRDDISGKLNTAGTATAYTITSNQGFSALTDGIFIAARVHVSSGESPTLNVDSLGAKSIRVANGVAVPSAGMPAGALIHFTYDSGDDCWYAQGKFADPPLPPANIQVPTGSVMLFFTSAAPTGWTKQTTHNDKAIRIVSGAGGGAGGSSGFASVFTSRTPGGTVGNTALTVDQIPAHTHTFPGAVLSGSPTGSGATRVESQSTLTTDSTGGGQAHTHSFTGNAMDFSVAYVDALICTKN